MLILPYHPPLKISGGWTTSLNYLGHILRAITPHLSVPMQPLLSIPTKHYPWFTDISIEATALPTLQRHYVAIIMTTENSTLQIA